MVFPRASRPSSPVHFISSIPSIKSHNGRSARGLSVCLSVSVCVCVCVCVSVCVCARCACRALLFLPPSFLRPFSSGGTGVCRGRRRGGEEEGREDEGRGKESRCAGGHTQSEVTLDLGERAHGPAAGVRTSRVATRGTGAKLEAHFNRASMLRTLPPRLCHSVLELNRSTRSRARPQCACV